MCVCVCVVCVCCRFLLMIVNMASMTRTTKMLKRAACEHSCTGEISCALHQEMPNFGQSLKPKTHIWRGKNCDVEKSARVKARQKRNSGGARSQVWEFRCRRCSRVSVGLPAR